MTELFGIPMGDILVVMLIAFVVVLGIVAVFAIRSRIFLRLALRSASRRLGRTALIVAGLMLGTTIITAAFSTGDTMSYTIRSEVVDALGNIDEVVSRQGAELGATIFVDNVGDVEYFDESLFEFVDEAASESEDIDGLTPAIIEIVGVQDLTSAQTEPRVTIFAADPARMAGFGDIRDSDSGEVLTLADLAPGEIYLNAEGADELRASTGDEVAIFAAGGAASATVKAVVEYDGAGTTESAVLMPLAEAQKALNQEGMIKHVLVSNRGGDLSGMNLTDAVIEHLEPTLSPLNLEADPTKQDSVDLADETGAAFLSVFITFGSFSVIAGMLLIFLIFVMLAQERKGEMGVTRAVGAQRGHLAQAFAFEGVAYDLLAALFGGAAGVAIAFGMVIVLAQALGDIAEIRHTIVPRSIVIAYIIGMLVTFIVVTISAWRVSALNIVRAIRDLPDPIRRRSEGRGWIFGIIAIILGILLAYVGADSKTAAPLSLGVSMVIIGSVPVLLRVGLPDRAAYTVPGLILVIYWLLPFDTFISELSMDFTIFILSGIFVVTGATWIVMYNSDILIARSAAFFSRLRGLAPALKTAVAYPLTSKFRTGVTLAMFTLVVFTMVVMSITITSFGNAFDNEESFGGGYDIRATAVASNPILDPQAAVAEAPGLNPADFHSVALQSSISVRARQVGFEETKEFEDYAVLGFDDSFLANTTYGLAARASGYDSDRAVWDAIRDEPGLAIVSQDAVPRRQNWGFSAGLPDFRLEGFYIEDQGFDPVNVRVVDQQTNTNFDVTIIGVLSDAGPFFMTGITTSQAKLETALLPERIVPTTLWVDLQPGVDAEDTAEAMESAFLANGLEANSLAEELADAVQLNQTFNYIIQGFMSLGLIVGVVAIGVISARSVVERRQQIGVLRSIGFQKSTVQLSFLLESSLVAIIGIFVGTVLGLIVAYDVIDQAAATGSWANLKYTVPFRDLAIIFTLVYLAALLASWFPARQAARVYPAEALRYE
jgi:putative ABC transport system permease protein